MRVVLQILERVISNKQKKKKTFHSASTTNLRITYIYAEDFFFFLNFDVPILPVAIGSLLYLTPS